MSGLWERVAPWLAPWAEVVKDVFLYLERHLAAPFDLLVRAWLSVVYVVAGAARPVSRQPWVCATPWPR